MTDRTDLADRVHAHPQWYHTLELAPGLVTPGWYDLRPVVDRSGFPQDLTGQRCLDVATFDGFWARTMEERGASDVVAIDLLDMDEMDWPVNRSDAAVRGMSDRKKAGEGFLIVRDALGSKVERRELSVYDLNPDDVGTFDFVYVGSLLLHLRDPVRALEAVRSVCARRFMLIDAIHLPNTIRSPRQPNATFDGYGRPWWWKPNRAGLVRMVESAGFEVTEKPRIVLMPPGHGQRRPTMKQSVKALRHAEGRSVVFRSHVGDPHLAIQAHPVHTWKGP